MSTTDPSTPEPDANVPADADGAQASTPEDAGTPGAAESAAPPLIEPDPVVAEQPGAFGAAAEPPAFEAPTAEPVTPADPAPSSEAPAPEAPAYQSPSYEAPAPEAPAYQAPGFETPAAEAEVIEAEVVEEDVPAAPPPTAATTPVDYAVAPAAGYAAPPAPGYGAAQGEPQVVYVQPITPPKKAGNRGLGTLLALAGTVVYAAVLVLATWLIGWFINGATSFAFIASGKFWIPVAVFGVAFILLVLLANRANWWAYILGSLFVGLAVYFGTIGVAALIDVILRITPQTSFEAAATSPWIIVATLLARELSMWFGSLIARRGRRVKAKNAEAREAYEREAQERRAAAGY